MTARCRDTFRHRFDIWSELTRKYFKLRYKGSVLGYVWALLHPLLLTAIFYLVFGRLLDFGNRPDDFALFLAAGLFIWSTFHTAVIGGSSIFFANGALVQKIRFPRWLLVMAMVSCDILHMILAIPVLLLFMHFHGSTFNLLALLVGIPLVALAQVLLCFAVALAVGTLNAYFRDLGRFLEVFMRFAFYLSPILYPAALYGAWRPLLYFHPAGCLVVCYRGLFTEGTIAWKELGAGFAGALVLATLAITIYRRFIPRIAEVL